MKPKVTLYCAECGSGPHVMRRAPRNGRTGEQSPYLCSWDCYIAFEHRRWH